MTDTITRYTLEEWLAEAERRFGPDSLEWRFVCPVCGNIQKPNDFKPYKDRGALLYRTSQQKRIPNDK